MIETFWAVLFGMMCGGSLLAATYIMYTGLTYGWQAAGDQFDAFADMIWHINNVYEEQ